MLDTLKKIKAIKRLRKSMRYSRIRQWLPSPEARYTDDRDRLEDAEIIKIDWPMNIKKPRVGIVKDFERYPRWTKYRRFLENNHIPHDYCDIHAHDWLEKVKEFDVIAGLVGNEINHLDEIRKKYFILETVLGKKCFPSATHALLYEDKALEAYLAKIHGIPYAKTYVSYPKEDALGLAGSLSYPLVSKINHSSGSMGVSLIGTPRQARKIIEESVLSQRPKVHVQYFRQKNYVYFQEYIPNDGYDIRVIFVGNWAFGYYRKVLEGDFRASGMDTEEKGALPEEALRIAHKVNKCIQSPLLAVDMVHGLDGQYTIIEFSPNCYQLEDSGELQVNGDPGVYVIEDNGNIHFEKGRYWVNELALRQFLVHDYLPSVSATKLSVVS